MMTIDAASLISRIPIALPYRYWADLADRAVDQGAALELGLDGPTLDNVPLSELKDWANRFQGLKKRSTARSWIWLRAGSIRPWSRSAENG